MARALAIVGTVGIPARYGGFETLAENLALQLSGEYDITVYCSSRDLQTRPDNYAGAQLRYIPIAANGVQSIAYDIISMCSAMRSADVVIVLGVSGCLALPLLKLLGRCRFVVNIDGLEWRRDKWHWLAQQFLRLCESAAVRCADAVVADNTVIRDYVLGRYNRDAALISYGGDALPFPTAHLPQDFKVHSLYGQRYAASVCRIEPENNIHLLLEAVSHQSRFSLVVIGNWDASEYGRQLRRRYGSSKRLHLLDPIFDINELDAIRMGCTLYLHGHSAGGTNPSLVEAMCRGLSVCALDVTYNRATTGSAALYFTDAAQLTRILETVDDAEMEALGERMAGYAASRYRWSLIAEQYAALIESLPAR